jgi:hypothetical protein
MATSAQQATYAAQKGKNWAAPGEAGFGQAGYTDQADYDAYSAANPGGPQTPAPSSTQSSSYPAGPQTTGQVLNQAAPAAGQPPTTVTGAFQQALMSKLTAGPTTAQSASVQPAIQANQVAEQRGMEQSRALAAERAAAQGIDQNGFNSALMGLQSESNGRQSQFAGNAVMDQNNQERQQLMSLLGLTGGLLGQEDSRGLQRYGIDQDAGIRREGIAQQGALGQGDLALRGRLGDNANRLSLLGLMQNDRQFDAGLGQQGAQFGAQLDQNGLLSLLGLL